MSKTPATVVLDRLGIPYETLEYDTTSHEGGYGIEAAEVLGIDPDSVGKTLVATLDDGSEVCAVVPVSARLDLKSLAGAAGAKRATMTDPAVAERITGYVVGGISPLGQRRQLRVFVDEFLVLADPLYVSGGRRGLEIVLSPADLLEATGGTAASLTA